MSCYRNVYDKQREMLELQAAHRRLEAARAIKQVNAKTERGKKRGIAFVSLFAAAKQLVDNHPKRFPYLEYAVRGIEKDNLAPPLENTQIGATRHA